MFLTRMFLNPTRVTTKRMLASPHVAHALVMGGIPPGSVPGRVLWRIDAERDSSRLALYLVSPGRPDLTGMVEQVGWPTEATWETRSYDPFLGRLRVGQQWRFRLTANPVRSLSQGPGVRGKVLPHVTVDHQLGWLLARVDRIGVSIPRNGLGELQVGVRGRSTATFGRRSITDDGPRRDRVELTTATFDGLLQVGDAEALRHALTDGVGRAKGYGCGLLTLAPQ
jgi:CRISPR system Cascade subunit CasE